MKRYLARELLLMKTTFCGKTKQRSIGVAFEHKKVRSIHLLLDVSTSARLSTMCSILFVCFLFPRIQSKLRSYKQAETITTTQVTRTDFVTQTIQKDTREHKYNHCTSRQYIIWHGNSRKTNKRKENKSKYHET